MRLPFCIFVLACIFALVAAWSKEDQEIFRLRDEVEASEGVDVTFYDFIGVLQSANQEEINKAYRKKSKSIHPDKVKQKYLAERSSGSKGKPGGQKPGVHVSKGPSQSDIRAATKAASDRFARLGIVANILRGPGRERYDFFVSNGFPKWKGTGYYYARFRPGLGSVLVGLFVFVGGGGHWLALYMSWKRQKDFVGRYIKFARHTAWGDSLGIPALDDVGNTTGANGAEESDPMAQTMNRRQRRMQEKDAKKDKSEKKTKFAKASSASPAATPPVGAVGPKKRVVAENGKILVVDAAGNVYLEQADEDGETHEFLLDPNELLRPTVRDTALYRIPVWAYRRYLARYLDRGHVLGETPNEEVEEDEVEGKEAQSSGSSDFEVLEKVKTTAENGTLKSGKRSKKSGKGR